MNKMNYYFRVIFKHEATNLWTESLTATGEYCLLSNKKIQAHKNV